MVSSGPSQVLLEPGAPQWAQRFALRLPRTYLNLYPNAPVRLWSVLKAELPNPADWAGSMVWVSDVAKPAFSTGVAWLNAAGGPI